MRSKLIALLVGLGLAAVVAPALACNYETTASDGKASSQQTAQSQQTGDVGAN